uniref:MMS19 nucleotide excision repair protein n=1 Tax=Heterorhabditis bacteriophora TaxID=37862 RepID=A0A1I7WYJ8_HETBA
MDFVLELNSLDKDLVIMFIKTVGGERDPRCLLLVFRLFIMVVSSYPIGPFVEDLFEVIACYYPVEFKPLPTENLITRDLLSRSCATCLLAHPSFAPFCYMLIEEKFADDECSIEQKYDVCELLADATVAFPLNYLLPQLTSLLAGLRSMALDPKSKGPVSKVVLRALNAVVSVLDKTGDKNVEEIAYQMLENLEPFVLQAEMGLTERALCMLRCVVETSLTSSRIVFDKTLAWIIMLVQGDTINTAANRIDIMKEALSHLDEWSTLALDRKADDLGERSEHLLQRGLTSVQNDCERASFLEFITSHSKARWSLHYKILEEYADPESEKFILVLCASVVDAPSWIDLRFKIMEGLSKDPSRTNLNGYIAMANRMASSKEIILQLADELKDLIVNLVVSINNSYLISTIYFDFFYQSFSALSLSDSQKRDALAESMQSIGLLLDENGHRLIIESIIRQLSSDCPLLIEMFRLILVQSNTLSDSVGDIRALAESDLNASCTIAKAHLLAGKTEGVDLINEQSVLLSLDVLDLLARSCSPFVTQPYIDTIVRSTIQILGHKKRIVRQKAAVVRNLWVLESPYLQVTKSGWMV